MLEIIGGIGVFFLIVAFIGVVADEYDYYKKHKNGTLS